MTREEAIEYAEKKNLKLEEEIERPGSYYGAYAMYSTELEFVSMALSALRQEDHFLEVTKKVEPLTMDEMRQMDGEPVWCEIYIKGQPSFYGIVHGEKVTGFIPGDDKPANLAITNVGAYGFAWLAYRQKPEEGTV